MANFVATKGIALRSGGDTIIPLDRLAEMSRFVYGCGQWANTVSIERFIFEESVRILGDDHPDTLGALNNLASTLGDQGKLPEAAAIQTEVLEKRRHILGDNHPDTLSAMSNLAAMLGYQGKLPEAAAMFQEMSEKRRHILGDDHTDTVRAMNGLQIILERVARKKRRVYCCW